jgi:hypothetical protein
MATRFRLTAPVTIGETTVQEIVLRDMRCADLFQAAREISDGGSSAEMKCRVAALAAELPFAAARAMPLAVQVAFEKWWETQWQRTAPALPAPVRAPVAGDFFDAHAVAGSRAGDLELDARIYALCADITLDDIDDLPPSALNQVTTWYDGWAKAPIQIEEIQEAGSAAPDPSPEA